MASTEIVEKVQGLVALAQSQDKDGQPTNEARNAAVSLVQLLKKEDLVIVPKADLEAATKAVEGATALRKAAKAERMKGAMFGFLGAQILGKGKLF